MATGSNYNVQQKQQHVVAVPMPAQGHLNPMMRFCELLAKQEGFLVTFVDFDAIHDRLQQVSNANHHKAEEEEPPAAGAVAGAATVALPKYRPAAAAAPVTAALPPPPPLIRRAHIPMHGFDLSNNFNVSFRHFFGALPSIAPYLEDLILSLSPPVTCLLSDFNITIPTQDVAHKLGIPRVVLFPCCASRLLFAHYLSQGQHISIPRVMEALEVAKTKRGEVFCKGLPGLPTLRSGDIPHFKHVMDDTLFLWETTTQLWQVCNAGAHAVVVNSFKDLEESTFDTLSKASNVPIYDVGFWLEPLSKGNATSLWKEDTTCMTWLDQQSTSSVLYISFGSITLLSKSQFEEFEDGLISSKQRFLWVFRPRLVHDMDYSSCVASILFKSHGKGTVVSWAPQLQVLAHPSVGGFLTHCGWNSTTESINNGVPMLCWPYFADQLINARCIVDEWKVGLGFKPSKHDNNFIARDEIQKVIRTLMEGQEGKLVRQNAKNLKEKSDHCLLESGSSFVKLKALSQSLW